MLALWERHPTKPVTVGPHPGMESSIFIPRKPTKSPFEPQEFHPHPRSFSTWREHVRVRKKIANALYCSSDVSAENTQHTANLRQSQRGLYTEPRPSQTLPTTPLLSFGSAVAMGGRAFDVS